MLSSDLLKSDGPQQHCASRKFLAGAAAVVTKICVDSLCTRFAEQGVEAFDPTFLLDSGDGDAIVPRRERRLLSSHEVSLPRTPENFSGSTQFFFLTAALLRVGLFPCLRAQQELYFEHTSIFAQLREAVDKARGRDGVAFQSSEQAKVSTDASLGWETLLRDVEFVKSVTKFSMLQLRWLNSVAENSASATGDRKSVV